MNSLNIQERSRNTTELTCSVQVAPQRLEDVIVAVQRDVATIRQGLPTAGKVMLALVANVDGLSASEVRDALQLSESNQRVLLHRARSSLRRFLSEVQLAGRHTQAVSAFSRYMLSQLRDRNQSEMNCPIASDESSWR